MQSLFDEFVTNTPVIKPFSPASYSQQAGISESALPAAASYMRHRFDLDGSRPAEFAASLVRDTVCCNWRVHDLFWRERCRWRKVRHGAWKTRLVACSRL